MEDVLTSAEELRIETEASLWDGVYANTEQTQSSCETSNLFDMEEFLNHLIVKSKGMRILSIGGGIDFTAVYLANSGAHVCSIDISRVACEKTKLLATRSRPKGSLQVF